MCLFMQIPERTYYLLLINELSTKMASLIGQSLPAEHTGGDSLEIYFQISAIFKQYAVSCLETSMAIFSTEHALD